MVGFRVVDQSSFTFKTDLPPSSRNIHPSGVLHAFRSSPREKEATKSGDDGNDGDESNDKSDNATKGVEEHAFAWIENALHIENALNLLEKHGFHRCQSIVFIPYSTKANWLERYPHAEPALECTETGRCVVHLNWRPYPNALGEMETKDAVAAAKDDCDGNGKDDRAARDGGEDAAAATERHQRKKYKQRAIKNIFDDKTFIPDAERDELHVEIYNYFSWLHGKVAELERKAELLEFEKKVAAMVPPAENVDDVEAEVEIEGEGEGEADNGKKKKAERDRTKKNTGVVVAELQGVMEKMESAFLIIPNVKLEAEAKAAEAAAAAEVAAAEEVVNMQQQEGGDEEEGKEEAAGEERPGGEGAAREEQQGGEGTAGEEQQGEEEAAAAKAAMSPRKEEKPPFLEEHLSEALFQKVAARENAGESKRRSRKRKRQATANPQWVVEGFDDMFDRLVRYKEEHGDCAVPRNPRKVKDENTKLANWVNAIRDRRRNLVRDGLECEEAVPGKRNRILTKTLTAERIARLDSIGFVWSVAGPKVAWEDRFRELLEHREAHGRWPSQSMGKLGEWVHKQRVAYAKGDANYMRDKAPKLDEVGFEWTPRGNTRVNWEEGFEMLMEFGRINGHYDVPCPGEEVDRKSDGFRLYHWVESLHRLYRSYKIGRQSGSLTDERVLLLIKHGFEFRNE